MSAVQRIIGVEAGIFMWLCMLMSFRSSAEQLRSSAEEIQHGRALLKIFGCSAAKCLISSCFGNQIHVHLVLRGQVCEKKRQQIYWGKTTSPQNKRPMCMVVLIPVAFFYDCGEANLKKQRFCVFAQAPIFNDKCAFNQVSEEILWIFSCNCSSFALCVSRPPQTKPSPTDAGRNRPTQQYSRKETLSNRKLFIRN